MIKKIRYILDDDSVIDVEGYYDLSYPKDKLFEFEDLVKFMEEIIFKPICHQILHYGIEEKIKSINFINIESNYQ